MLTDEQAAAQRKALQRERAGYETRILIAQEAEDDEQVAVLKDRIKQVDRALNSLGSLSDLKKAELLNVAASKGVEVDKSMKKVEILEALGE